MKNKKIISIIFVAVALLLIGAGIIYSLSTKEPSRTKETNTSKGNDPENYKVAELQSIQTPDKKIRLSSTKVYESNGISGMMVHIIPYENFDKVYLKMTLKLSKSDEIIVLYLENLKKKEEKMHEVQSLNDWSTLESWSIEIVTEEEAKRIKESQK